jgi:hypothetical protein
MNARPDPLDLHPEDGRCAADASPGHQPSASAADASSRSGTPNADHGCSIGEAAQIAAVYGYFVTQGNGRAVFIQRKRNGDSIALIRGREIVPYAHDYNANDHLVALAVSGGPAS